MSSIKVTPKDWWNPFSWRRAKKVEKLYSWYWDKNKDKIIQRWHDEGWRMTMGHIVDD